MEEGKATRSSGMIERRKTPRKDWVVGKDEIGHSVLEWKVDSRDMQRHEADPCERTYDFLKRLDLPSLTLEDTRKRLAGSPGRNPYDTGSFPLRKPGRR